MEHLLQEVRKSLAETQQQMQSLSQGHGDLRVRVEESLQQLQQDCYRLENFVRKEVPQRRQEAKYCVDQVVTEVNDLRRAFDAFKKRRQNAEQEAKQREELLSRRFVPNNEDSSTSIQIDHGLHHHTRLQNANSQLDEIIYQGQTTFTSLRSQHLTLKGAQRKMLDMMNTLGLSNTVMRFIERRTQQDKWIFWTGVVVTVTIMVLVVMYFT